LNLGPNGSIVLQGLNSTLLLDGITLKGINGTNVRCMDTTNTMTLKNVKWVQSGDFTFNTGGIQILDDTTFISPFNFTYASNVPIQIMTAATFSIIRNQSFTLAPPNGSPDMILFADSNASLLLDEATLNIVPGVLNLDVGRLIIRDANFISGTINFGPTLIVDQSAGASLIPI